jgi:hypothetical protein
VSEEAKIEPPARGGGLWMMRKRPVATAIRRRALAAVVIPGVTVRVCVSLMSPGCLAGPSHGLPALKAMTGCALM